MDNREIGVFDSGVGGVSVLRDLARVLPKENFAYLGDTKYAPYGVKGEEEILFLTENAVDRLMRRDIKALVIACNTATSAAAAHLRQKLSIPVIGMEPALKPASLATKSGKIAVLATPATLRQEKFQRLFAQCGQNAVLLPCPGLMEFAERCELEGERLDEYLKGTFSRAQGDIAAVVLGCTHYVFLKKAIQKALPNATLFDGNEGTARRLKSVLAEKGMGAVRDKGSVSFFTTGDEKTVLPLMETLFHLPL